MTTVFLCAGDVSGEQHAAALVNAMRERLPEASFVGLGGPHMEKAGVELVVHQHDIAVGGLVEVLGDVGRIASAWRRLRRVLREDRPDLVVLVDAPDFNIPLARTAHKLGLPILYYISPQVWAWRRGRIAKIARRVDRMAVIFPFEVEVYAGTGLPVEFVGHPLLDRLRPFLEGHPAGECRAALGMETGPWLALLPGSRRNEVRDTLPLQLAVARAVHARNARVRFAVGVAPSIPRETIDAKVREAALPPQLDLRVFEGRTHEVIRACDAALAKPGTVTVEIAVLGTPVVVAARAHPLTAFLMRRLVKVPSFTMPNLIAGETVIPEFLQEEALPDAIAEALLERLQGPVRAEQESALARVRERLGHGGAADRTADLAVEMIHRAAAP
ncbi:MAG: lipid-A-disaccharide synthase [Planctomycetota bacterium]|jgi:lipid-A-disaccharide synthase|nr:lipid-A-disaccharide synthase [Deltaproteobacteria bacterium]MDP6540546.1 lipid-A-disaccharide synthase [Planctomycetota bacterium]